ncbi:MAG: hypothetical protein EBW19_03890 [Betaproteobacteria bacterium]|nr:hypothetical protein [Betaproteobacteria bacterium]
MRRMYRALGIKAVTVSDLPPVTRKAKTIVETRAHYVQDMEIRAVGEKMTFKGYAAVFNSDSEPLPFIEQIKPGAFSRTLKSRNNIRMYVNHNDSALLASTRSGTLRLNPDSDSRRPLPQQSPRTQPWGASLSSDVSPFHG